MAKWPSYLDFNKICIRKDESPSIIPKAERKRRHRNYRKEKHKDEEFSDISDEEGGSRNKSVSKYASVASSFIEAVESATIKGLVNVPEVLQ